MYSKLKGQKSTFSGNFCKIFAYKYSVASDVPFICFYEDEVLQQLKKCEQIFYFTIANVFALTFRSLFE